MKLKILLFFSLLLISCAEKKLPELKYKIDDTSYSSVSQSQRIRYIIVHYTHADDELSFKLLTEMAVSSHYLITSKINDPIYQLVDDKYRAWHAGESQYEGRHKINDSSIGIEIVHMGYDEETILKEIRAQKNKDEPYFIDYEYYNKYSKHQIEKLAGLIIFLSKEYNIHPKNILGHSDVAPTRKQDPGARFPWKWLYENHDIGLWYDQDDYDVFMTNNDYSNLSVFDIKKEFIDYGYSSMPTNDIWDNDSREVLYAFQSKFRNNKIDGNIDLETYVIAKSLNKKVLSIDEEENTFYDIK